MKARHLIIVFLLLLAPFGGNTQEVGGKRVLISDDKLSVHVTNAPLFDILKEISAVTGMEVKVDPEVNTNVTCSFEDVPIDRGIARLVHPLDYVIKWRGITEMGQYYEEITSVEVFKEGERDKAQQLLSPIEPHHGPEDIQRDESLPMQNEENLRLQSRPSRRKKPQTPYRSSIREADAGESGTSGGGSRETTGHVRIRKFEAITDTDTDSYNELSP